MSDAYFLGGDDQAEWSAYLEPSRRVVDLAVLQPSSDIEQALDEFACAAAPVPSNLLTCPFLIMWHGHNSLLRPLGRVERAKALHRPSLHSLTRFHLRSFTEATAALGLKRDALPSRERKSITM